MLKFQLYNKYKLPVTINPLDYGKLILKVDDLNLFIIQLNTFNIALIYQYPDFNHIKIFKEGTFAFEYKDHKLDSDSFIRSLDNRRFTFKNGNLFSIERLITVIISILLMYFILTNFTPFNEINIAMTAITGSNIIRLRKRRNINV